MRKKPGANAFANDRSRALVRSISSAVAPAQDLCENQTLWRRERSTDRPLGTWQPSQPTNSHVVAAAT